ncbi:surface protease GP63, putative, partial [Trypanosoma cruzi]
MLTLLFGGENVCAMPGIGLFVVSGHASHEHDACEGPEEETYLSAAMHAALGCLVMQVRLRVVEKGGVVGSHARTGRRLRGPLDRTVREALLAVATRRCARYPPRPAVSFRWFRGTARREGVEQDGPTGNYWTRIARGHPSPLRRALIPAVAPHRRMSTGRTPEESVARGEAVAPDAPTGDGV